MSKNTLAIVIPVYNEEKNIEKVIQDWLNILRPLQIKFKICIYADGPTDNTLAILENIKTNNPELRITHKKNSGHGPTILRGYLDNLDSAWIFQADSDNEISVSHFPELWQVKDNFDLVIGIRQERKSPMVRKIISLISRLMIRSLYGKGISDTNIPYRLMRTSFFKSLIPIIPQNSFAPNVLISGMAVLKEAKFCSIPVHYNNRQFGPSSLSSLKLFKAVIKSFWQTLIFRFTLTKY